MKSLLNISNDKSMYIIDEKDLKYENEDIKSGYKYIMRGPRMGFANICIPSNTDIQARYHNTMEENFYVLEGRIDIVIDGVLYTLTKDHFIHIEPGEVFYIVNPYEEGVRLVSSVSPYLQKDTILSENPKDYRKK